MGGVRKFEESDDGYNKMQTYRGMLLDLTRNLRNCLGVVDNRRQNTRVPHNLHSHSKVK